MLRCTVFDFESKHHEEISLADVAGVMAAERARFVWLDLECAPGEVNGIVEREIGPVLGLGPGCRALLAKSNPDTGYEHLPDVLHMSMVSCERPGHATHLSAVAAAYGPAAGTATGDAEPAPPPGVQGVQGGQGRVDRIKVVRVDAILADRFLLTVSRGRAPFLEGMRRDFADDFRRFAHSQGFLLYELWDHLTRSYEAIEHTLEKEVEKIQTRLAQRPDASVFPAAARVSANLVRLRRHVAPARAVVHEIGTRRFAQVPQTTQPFLQSTAAELDRVLSDLTTSREILTDAVNLGMSYVNFRTSRVINRLTTVSFIFLPLTFLVGVYGMNFEHQPEYKWRHGYLWFWLLAMLITLTAFTIIAIVWRREKLPVRE